MNLSWIHDDSLALHQSFSPATPYKRLHALGDSWYQIPLQMLVRGNEIKYVLAVAKSWQQLNMTTLTSPPFSDILALQNSFPDIKAYFSAFVKNELSEWRVW